jgi:hypothetical protein
MRKTVALDVFNEVLAMVVFILKSNLINLKKKNRKRNQLVYKSKKERKRENERNSIDRTYQC